MSKLSNNLVRYREQRGLKQADVADQLGYSRTTLSFWERGHTTPKTFALICLADLYEVSLDELVGREFNGKNISHR